MFTLKSWRPKLKANPRKHVFIAGIYFVNADIIESYQVPGFRSDLLRIGLLQTGARTACGRGVLHFPGLGAMARISVDQSMKRPQDVASVGGRPRRFGGRAETRYDRTGRRRRTGECLEQNTPCCACRASVLAPPTCWYRSARGECSDVEPPRSQGWIVPHPFLGSQGPSPKSSASSFFWMTGHRSALLALEEELKSYHYSSYTGSLCPIGPIALRPYFQRPADGSRPRSTSFSYLRSRGVRPWARIGSRIREPSSGLSRSRASALARLRPPRLVTQYTDRYNR